MVKTLANQPCGPMPIFARGVNAQTGKEAKFMPRLFS
jgi:hypothetical protein